MQDDPAMVRTKNPIVSPTQGEDMIPLVMESTKNPTDIGNPTVEEGGEEEEETQSSPIDSKKSDSIDHHSTDSEALQPLRMFFSPTEYNKPIKISAKCYIGKAVETLEGLLKPDEMKWFIEHPQFSHFFHMHRDSSHTLMGMWMLLVRMARLEKNKECWFIVNGVPIRYSLQEHALLSGLYCHPYPNHYEKSGSLTFVEKHFKVGSRVTYEDVEKKLLSLKHSPDRLKMAVLYFLCSVIIGKKKTGKGAPSVHSFFLRAVNDLKLCKTFPWGRLAFEENMKDIFHLMSHFNGVVQSSWIFPSFVIPLELLAFEAIPVLNNNFRDVKDADPECPRMCKMKFKTSSKQGLRKEMFEKLGTTKEIQSILVPSRHEKVLLGRIMEEERGWNDKDDPVADGWRRRLIEKKKSIWFEELYNQDVATRAIEANAGTENAIVGRKTVGRKNVARGNVDPENVWKDILLDLESRLKIALDDGLQKMNEKIDGLDSRVKSQEAYVNFSRSQGDQRDEQQRDQLRISDSGGKDEGNEMIEDEASKGKGDGEGKKSEMEKTIEDEPSDKDAKKKKRKEQEGGEPNDKDAKKKKRKEQEGGEPSDKDAKKKKRKESTKTLNARNKFDDDDLDASPKVMPLSQVVQRLEEGFPAKRRRSRMCRSAKKDKIGELGNSLVSSGWNLNKTSADLTNKRSNYQPVRMKRAHEDDDQISMDEEDDNMSIARMIRSRKKYYSDAEKTGGDASEPLGKRRRKFQVVDSDDAGPCPTLASVELEQKNEEDDETASKAQKTRQICDDSGPCQKLASVELEQRSEEDDETASKAQKTRQICDDSGPCQKLASVELEHRSEEDDETASKAQKTRQICDEEVDVNGNSAEKKSMIDDGTKKAECWLHEYEEKMRCNEKRKEDIFERLKQRKIAIKEKALELETCITKMEKTLAEIRELKTRGNQI